MTEKTRWETYKEKNGVTPLDILRPNRVNAEPKIFQQRYSICESCPEFITLTKQCKQCGCFMALKAKFENAKCPIDKW